MVTAKKTIVKQILDTVKKLKPSSVKSKGNSKIVDTVGWTNTTTRKNSNS